MKLQPLVDKRVKLIRDARAILDAAEKETRAVTSEEQSRFDAMLADADGVQTQIEKLTRLEAAERGLAQPLIDDPLIGKDDPEPTPGAAPRDAGPRGTKEYLEAFRRFLRTGIGSGLIPSGESRALQADDATKGGTFVVPMDFASGLIKEVDNRVFIRAMATKYQVEKAESLGSPTLDTRAADAVWNSEIGTVTEDDTIRTGRRDLYPHPLTTLVKVSRTLLRKALQPADALVRAELAYSFARTEEKGFLTGTGANQPLGVFTASAQGISTSRDVSTDNTTTAPTMDGLVNAKYTLKDAYWPMAKWLAHRDFWKIVSKMKDADGQYIWRESVRAGEPDRLLNLPLMMSEYAPNTFTTGLYVAILGDFSWYRIADALSMDVQVLQELYAAANQVGFIARLETDGMPALEEAFVRVKLA